MASLQTKIQKLLRRVGMARSNQLVQVGAALARNSIGMVLVTGMIISTLFTLLVVPSIYMLIAGKREPKVDVG